MSAARISETAFTVFDLETTGLDTANDRIVELGLARFEPGQPPLRERFLVNPGCPIPKAASDVHRILDVHVRGEPPFATLAPHLAAWFEGGTVLVGYNARRFDARMLQAELERAGRPWQLDPGPLIDVLDIVNWHHRGIRGRKQVEIGVRYDVRPCDGDAHSAAVDAQMTGELLLAMVRHGVVPDDLDALRANLARWAQQIDEEFGRWGPWLYSDRETGRLRLGAGKHVGRHVDDADPDYLAWMLDNGWVENQLVAEAFKDRLAAFGVTP
jgi:DNA polymerase-3 subunit epsilon